MMIHAYQEMYLSRAQNRLGEAFDYAINSCNISGEDFVNAFVVSKISKLIAIGDTSYILGKSGIEIVREVILETRREEIEIPQIINYSRSPEYWVGWALAYYQWYSDRSYNQIFQAISFDELLRLYYPLHEADILKFVEIVDNRIRTFFNETNLKRIRNYTGYSQSELSKLSGVGLRSIQMYEQRNKDINKASLITIYQLSKALGCEIEDLIEK